MTGNEIWQFLKSLIRIPIPLCSLPIHSPGIYMYAKTHEVKHCDYAGRVYARCLGHKLGHLAPTATIGILL